MDNMVYITVYDWKRFPVLLKSLTLLGTPVVHTSVEVYGYEVAFAIFKERLPIGPTSMCQEQVFTLLEDLGPAWRGVDYHLLHRNCNHFSLEFCQKLVGETGPRWMNRGANILGAIAKALPYPWVLKPAKVPSAKITYNRARAVPPWLCSDQETIETVQVYQYTPEYVDVLRQRREQLIHDMEEMPQETWFDDARHDHWGRVARIDLHLNFLLIVRGSLPLPCTKAWHTAAEEAAHEASQAEWAEGGECHVERRLKLEQDKQWHHRFSRWFRSLPLINCLPISAHTRALDYIAAAMAVEAARQSEDSRSSSSSSSMSPSIDT